MNEKDERYIDKLRDKIDQRDDLIRKLKEGVDTPYTQSDVGEYVRAEVDEAVAIKQRIEWLVEATERSVCISRYASGTWHVSAGFSYEGQGGLVDALGAAVRGVYGKAQMPALPKGCEVGE